MSLTIIRQTGRLVRLANGLAMTLAILTTGPIAASPARAGGVTALVPAYFYPTRSGSPWDDLNAAAALIPVEAILNPASGPGPSANPDYQRAVAALHAAGGRVIGYVPTGYGSRPQAAILADVASYLSWYGVDGIFLDNMGNQSGGLNYTALYRAIKALGAGLHVVGNPGLPFVEVEAYLAAADTLVIFEGPLQNADPIGASFLQYPLQGPYAGLPLWFTAYPRSRLANLVFGVPAPPPRVAVPTPTNPYVVLTKAVGYDAGYVFLTDLRLPNPYGALPSYWKQEVGWIAYLNSLP